MGQAAASRGSRSGRLSAAAVYLLAVAALGSGVGAMAACCESLPGFSDPGASGPADLCAGATWPGQECVKKATLQEAEDMCAGVGARLCTRSELKTKVGKGMGCDLNKKYVWTASGCRSGAGNRIALGKNGKESKCKTSSSYKAGVICCADACPTPAPTTAPTPAPTPAPTAAPDAPEEATPPLGTDPSQPLKATHFWDCNGGSCDSGTLTTPWTDGQNPDYRYAAQYAPLDPADYGGALYGEKMWMTGAASDLLSEQLGDDDGCCGTDSEGLGGCGKCVLVRNPSAVNSDWTAIVMKKNRCPPWSNGCAATDLPHLDIAVPGYDNLAYSTANICGQSDTIISAAESETCGTWYNSGASTIEGCSCAALPSSTPEQVLLKSGCELFTAWGWTSGDPELLFEPVECPTAFKQVIEDAFGPEGPTGV